MFDVFHQHVSIQLGGHKANQICMYMYAVAAAAAHVLGFQAKNMKYLSLAVRSKYPNN